MFSLFRKGARRSPETILPSALGSRAMNLQERMAFRRDLAAQAVRDCLQSLGVAASHYRFRVLPQDARHHRYLVVLDIAADFEPRAAGRVLQQFEVEARLRRHAQAHYALVFEGIYWRLNQGAEAFERRQPERQTASSRPWELVSEEEKQALMEAIRAGEELPVLHVGELEYRTDMAPLEEPDRGRPRRG